MSRAKFQAEHRRRRLFNQRQGYEAEGRPSEHARLLAYAAHARADMVARGIGGGALADHRLYLQRARLTRMRGDWRAA